MLLVAACEERVRAVVSQVAACGRVAAHRDPDGSRFALLKETLLEGDITPTPEMTLAAPFVTVPTLALLSPDDEMPGANPAVARATFEAIAGPKEIVDIEGGHFGIMFDPSSELDLALGIQLAFLQRHLLRPSTAAGTRT